MAILRNLTKLGQILAKFVYTDISVSVHIILDKEKGCGRNNQENDRFVKIFYSKYFRSET